MQLRGAGHAAGSSSWRPPFVTGAVAWSVVGVVGWLLRAGSPRPRLGDLRLLYTLAGTGAVDSYLVGGARGLLLALHLLVAVVVGGLLALGLHRLTGSLPRAALVAAGLALLAQILFFVPVAR